MRTAAIPDTRKRTYHASSKRSALKRLLAGIRAPASDRRPRFERLDFGSSVREASRNADASARKGHERGCNR